MNARDIFSYNSSTNEVTAKLPDGSVIVVPPIDCHGLGMAFQLLRERGEIEKKDNYPTIFKNKVVTVIKRSYITQVVFDGEDWFTVFNTVPLMDFLYNPMQSRYDLI